MSVKQMKMANFLTELFHSEGGLKEFVQFLGW